MKKMHLIAVFFLSVLVCSSALSQKLANYDSLGHNKPSNTDFLVSRIKQYSTVEAYLGVADIVGGVVGSVADIAISIINNAIDKKQKSYSATYSNSFLFDIPLSDYDSLTNGSYQLIVKRMRIKSLDQIPNKDDEASVFTFNILKSNGILKVQLARLNLLQTRARSRNGDNLGLSFDIKISLGGDSLVKDTSTSNVTKKDKQKVDSSNSITIQNSVDLGEAKITVPILTRKTDTKIKSDNKFINIGYFDKLPKSNGKVQMIITASISEVNLNHLAPSLAATLLKGNSSDLTSILKVFFPGSSNSKK